MSAEHDTKNDNVTEMRSQAKQPLRKRGIYLLPNLLTTIALFSGFTGIVSAMAGDYAKASMAIFIAMIFDGLDGRVARMTNTSSEFGKEYDSLSDMVVFGVAPAIIMYEWALVHLKGYPWIWAELGWLAAFFYTAAAALRLAKFNTMANAGTADKRFFSGLPSPMAAALAMGAIWAATDNNIGGADYPLIALVITALAGVFMVSTIPFRSFKELNIGGRVSFFFMVMLVAALILVAIDPAEILFGVALAYVCLGALPYLWRKAKGTTAPEDEECAAEDEMDDEAKEAEAKKEE